MIDSIMVKLGQYYRKHILNACVDKGLFYTGGRLNIGDSMVPWLVSNVIGADLPYSNPRETKGDHLFTIGSILQYADSSSTVWGSGFISKDVRLRQPPKFVASVRGPLTQQRLIGMGIKCDKILGDPAILAPGYYQSDVNNENKIGLIPHYVDKPKLSKARISSSARVILCNVETDNIKKFVDQLMRCEVVVSSSLHGIILAEAYGIPAVWAKFDEDVFGDDFKFYDYYLSTGRKNVKPLDFYSISEKMIVETCIVKPSNLEVMASDILGCFPNDFA